MRSHFGHLPDGRAVEAFELRNAAGLELRVLSYGAIVQSLRVPDRSGRAANVVLGFGDLAGYVSDSRFVGPVVGRYAGRIAGSRFGLDGTLHQLEANDGRHHLHGGPRGFHRQLWMPHPGAGEGGRVGLRLPSPDGDAGYPGRLSLDVSYVLSDASELSVEYVATTDRATPLNLTQHSYFNLAGAGQGDILGHVLSLDADQFTPVGAGLIPTGELLPVDGTPLDFRRPSAIGARIRDPHEQIRVAGGYDHNFVLRRQGPGLFHAARLEDPVSGRRLDGDTSEPGLQFYSGNRLGPHAGLCLETQHFPDSPNQPHFPSTILRPGDVFRSRTVFRFGWC